MLVLAINGYQVNMMTNRVHWVPSFSRIGLQCLVRNYDVLQLAFRAHHPHLRRKDRLRLHLDRTPRWALALSCTVGREWKSCSIIIINMKIVLARSRMCRERCDRGGAKVLICNVHCNLMSSVSGPILEVWVLLLVQCARRAVWVESHRQISSVRGRTELFKLQGCWIKGLPLILCLWPSLDQVKCTGDPIRLLLCPRPEDLPLRGLPQRLGTGTNRREMYTSPTTTITITNTAVQVGNRTIGLIRHLRSLRARLRRPRIESLPSTLIRVRMARVVGYRLNLGWILPYLHPGRCILVPRASRTPPMLMLTRTGTGT